MDSKQRFRLKLAEIASQLENEKLEKIKFLCSDVIPAGDRERIGTPQQLFEQLEQRQQISQHRLDFLLECLEKVGRVDLAKELKTYQRGCSGKTEKGRATNASVFATVPGSSTTLLAHNFVRDAEKYYDRGNVEFQEGRYENACQQYANALTCLPKDEEEERQVKYLCSRAACYIELRKFAEAHEDCDAALFLRPHNENARYLLIQSLEGEGKISEAYREVSSLLQKSPQDFKVHNLETSLKEKVEVNRGKAQERRNHGDKCHGQARYTEAIKYFSEAIMLLPQLTMYADEMKDLYWRRARSHLKELNLEAAKRDCEEANRLVPQDVKVLYTWMQVLEKLKKYRECFNIANQLVDGAYKVKDARDTIERVLPKVERGDEDSKEEEEKKAISQSEDATNAKRGKRNKKKRFKKKEKKHGVAIKQEVSGSSRSIVVCCDEGDSDGDEPQADESRVIQSGTEKEQAKKNELTTVGSKGLLVEEGFLLADKEGTRTKEETYSNGSRPRKAQDKEFLDKTVPSVLPDVTATLTQEPLTGEAYPRRILLICQRWSKWHLSVCTVNRQLCRSFAKTTDIQVACLVLEATDQEIIGATRDGVNLIKAAPQPGICPGDQQLLLLHDDFPFKVDLVVGHGMVSGAAAAIQAKRLNCKLLHIFHNLPGEDEDCPTGSASMGREETERDLALKADFVAGVGPLLAEQWSMILNREVFMIMPGMPEVSPRNQIPTPQSRCLILGNMHDSKMNCLDLAIDALVHCRQRENPIHLTVLGTEREKVLDLKEYLNNRCGSSRVDIVVKPLNVSSEIVSVEVRGVSLVIIPSPPDGFALVALEAISSGVPVLISSSCGFAAVLSKEFGWQFADLLCCTMEGCDIAYSWANAIDNILDDREKAFDLAATLREKWNFKFTWQSSTNSLLSLLARSGAFPLLSPLVNQHFVLPSECSDSALRFVQSDVDLLDRRRKHVLFLSPENAVKSPFIRHFAQVPWIAVFDFDVKSVKTGYIASCESICENMGMKICRMLPSVPNTKNKKFCSVLPSGIPWVLVEGMPESKRNINESLEWVREFFVALGRTYPVPITFIVLWRSVTETEFLARKLSNILTIVRGSPLCGQVKLVIACTENGDVDSHLKHIAKDWGVELHQVNLEDVCNAICQCVSSSPFVQESQDFALPVADPNDPVQVAFQVLPSSSRWINAEMEVLYQSVGSTPQFETDDAYHFYRGGLISWYALQMGYAVERGNWKSLKLKVDELLLRAGTMKLKMSHQRGAGGTTSARKILFDYHEKYPCVSLKSVSHAEVAPAIKVLAAFCKLPVIILIDCKQVQSDEFDVDTLYNSLSNDRIPCVILEVIHQSQQKEKDFPRSGEKSEKTAPVRLADALDSGEAEEFVKIYSSQKKEKLSALRSLHHRGSRQLQIPFYYALTTFENQFTGLESFVKDCLQDLRAKEQQILLFLALAYHYGHHSLSANDFAEILQSPRYEVVALEVVLPDLSLELLLEEDGKWRPRHDLIAVEMLRQLLTMTCFSASPPVHPDNWKNHLADKAIDFFSYMPEGVVNDVLLSRITDDISHQYTSFSQLISDIPFEEDCIKLYEKAISDFPDNPFFKVHLGRYYSIQKRSPGFEKAIKYTDEGIRCSHDYSRLVRGQFAQMKGVVYSRQVNYLVEQSAEIKDIILMADGGVQNFRRAVGIAPDFVDGYIPEVRMMCKVFEYIDKKTGNFSRYVKSPEAHPFIIDAISNTSDTLECVPDSDEYAHWRMRLTCLGRRRFNASQIKETLSLLYHLRDSGRASRGSINRQIVIMTMDMCVKNGESLSLIAHDMIELLNEALKFDENIEQTMRLWVRLAPLIPVDLSEAESKVFHWCSKEKSVRSYLYKYIIACLFLLEGATTSYKEVMKNTQDDLTSEVKAINRSDVGRCRHPDRPLVWLADKGKGMGQLVFQDVKISEIKNVRMKRFIPAVHTKHLRSLTGIIVETGPKVGTIRVNGGLDVSFRTDLCETPLVSSVFMHRKVKFFLSFNFFGTDAYNVQLVAD